MTKLNDLQTIMLSTATQRDSGSLFPTPDNLANAGTRLTKAIADLIRRGLAEERETSDATTTHRADGDLAFGVFITDSGSGAIGVSDPSTEGMSPVTTPEASRATKSTTVIAMLQRDVGATLAELIAETGWLPHTTRAALTGVRKRGHVVERFKRDDATCYRIVEAV